MDWLKRMFGEGKIRMEVTLADGTKGVLKMSYIGSLATADADEIKEEATNRLYVEKGLTVRSIRILGAY